MKSILEVILLILLPVGFSKVNAQIVTKKDSINGNELTITMDKRIDDVIASMENECKKKSTRTVSEDTSSKPLSQAEICKKNPRILGYKIQVGVVKSTEEANNLRTEFRQAFPSIKVEIDASLRPNYKVLAGSYLSKESAAADLKKVKAKFKGAISTQYRVFCVEAK